MEPKIIVIKEDGSEDKQAMRREAVKNAIHNVAAGTKKFLADAWTFCKDNKEDLIVLVPLGLAAARGVTRLRSTTTQDSERERIDKTYYDPSTGAHWQLKRQLNNDERAELMRRRRRGEYTEDILEDMRVLK